jgi:hypothetical protein
MALGYIALISVFFLFFPVLAQDNSSPVPFDPGAIVFVNDPILPISDHADKDVYPVIPDVRVMGPASYDLGAECDASIATLAAWLDLNVSLPANVSRDNLSLQAA